MWTLESAEVGAIALVTLLTGALGIYIRARLTNVATKHDIAEITRQVEEVKALFAGRVNMSTAWFNLELGAYRQIWDVLCAAELDLEEGPVLADMDEQDAMRFAEEWKGRLTSICSGIRRVLLAHEPFLPTSVRSPLQAAKTRMSSRLARWDDIPWEVVDVVTEVQDAAGEVEQSAKDIAAAIRARLARLEIVS